MGTTATLAFIRGRRAIVAHVGDSRAYLVDQEQGWINQITSDHSFVEALLAAGHITDEQAAEHPMRNVLYRALGQAPDTTADTYDRYLKDGDRIVLCSDGLTRHIDPEEIAEIVLADENPEVATQRLIDLANKRGGEDNISAVVILMELSADATTELEPVGAAAEVDWEEQADLPEDTDPEIPVPDAVPVEPSDTEATLTEAPSEREELLQMLAGAGGDDTIPVRPEALSDSPVVPLNDAETDVAESMFVQSKEASTGTTAESIPAADVRLALKLDAEDDLDDDDDVLSEADD